MHVDILASLDISAHDSASRPADPFLGRHRRHAVRHNVLIRMGHWAWWMALVFGVLTTRVIFEGAIILFRTYDRLGAILKALDSAETKR